MYIKKISILLALNLAAFAFIFILKEGQQHQLHAHAIGLNLPADTFESLESITISTSLLPKDRIFVRKKQQWMMQSPIHWPANPFAIQRLINQLEFLEYDIRFSRKDMESSGQTLKDYGLEDPLLTIALKTFEDQFVLKIGKVQSDENRLYLLSPNGEEIIATSTHFLEPFLLDIAHLKSSTLFEIPPFEVQSLTVQMHQPKALKMRLMERDGRWSFEVPFSDLADNHAVEALIARFASLPIIEFIDNPILQTTGLDTPAVIITQKGLDRQEALFIGNRFISENGLPQVYAQLEGNATIFTLPADAFEDLQELQNDLRERHLVSASLQDIQSIEFMDGAHAIRLQRLDNNTWSGRLADGSSIPTDEIIIEEILNALKALEAREFLSDAPSERDLERWGLVTPQQTLILGGEDTEKLHFGNTNADGLIAVQKSHKPTVYGIPSTFLEAISTQPLFYKPRSIAILPKDAVIESMQLINLESQTTILSYDSFLKDAAINTDTPSLEAQKEETPQKSFQEYLRKLPSRQSQSLQKFLASCQNLRVQSFLEQQFNPQVALINPDSVRWKYRLEVSLLTSERVSRSVSFFFTDRLDAELQIGGLPHEALTFTLMPYCIDLLAELTES